jgi:hypothetical protein
MGWLAYSIALLALLFSSTKGESFNQGIYSFLNGAAFWNGVMFWIALGIWGIALLIVLGLLVFGNRDLKSMSLGCGCANFFLVGLPLFQGILWWMSSMMASTWTPGGLVDPVKFWLLVALFFLVGWSYILRDAQRAADR